MGVLRDLATTYRSLYVSLRYEKGQATGGALKNNTRRTVGLGAVVFRRWGVPPANIYLRVVPSEREGFQVEFRTQKPDPAPAEQELPSVMVHLREPVFKFGVNPLFPIDVSLLARAGIRKWSLRLINVNTGVAVKEYSGTSDPWVSLQWDGRNKNGAPVPAGEYQAFLTALGYGREPMTDSAGFIIKDPPTRLAPSSPAIAKSPPVSRPMAVPTPVSRPKDEEASETRRWAFVVRFGRDRADLAGSAALEIRQLAATLKAFPNEKVVVEGFSDLSEKEARTLAGQRARLIKDQLVETHDIESDRLIVRIQEPRPALEGENMQKTVTFFVGIEGK
ncbi:MAG: OmpA family protein [Elusimicrobia bacterium]|nr:OmpA family protein [Elusimicrobiota bacterium]